MGHVGVLRTLYETRNEHVQGDGAEGVYSGESGALREGGAMKDESTKDEVVEELNRNYWPDYR